jgi:uncharacterized protein
MRLGPVPDTRALLLELDADERDGPLVALIVAELHVGVETEMSRSGAHLPSGTDRLADELLALAEATGAGTLIVAGDFKQTIPVTTWQERRDVPHIISRLTKRLDLHIVLGNHDGGLRELIPKHHDVGVHPPDGIRLGGTRTGGGVGIFHGHAWPGKDVILADELVSAHTHPAVALVDGMGHAHIEPCWVRGPTDPDILEARYGPPADDGPYAQRMTIVPPFNPLLGGAAVNVDGLLGPAGKILPVGAADLYLLDGTHLGHVSDLPTVPEKWRRRRKPPSEDL